VNSDGPWQCLIRDKYLHKSNVSQCSAKHLDSHFWQGSMKVAPFFYRCCRKITGNGEETIFWEDVWIGAIPLKERFPRLYNLTFSVYITVAKVFVEGWGCIRFRRVLWGKTAQLWQDLKNLCSVAKLSDGRDRCTWLLEKSGNFSMKSMYIALKTKNSVCEFKYCWKVRIPLRVKVFIWLVFKKSILTRDNLLKRGWEVNDKCCFCCEKETLDHMLFKCPVTRYTWSIVACVLDDKDIPNSVDDVCSWVRSFKTTEKLQFIASGVCLQCSGLCGSVEIELASRIFSLLILI
jgi:hypothetical protein